MRFSCLVVAFKARRRPRSFGAERTRFLASFLSCHRAFNPAFVCSVAHQPLGTCLRRIGGATSAAFDSSVSVSTEVMLSTLAGISTGYRGGKLGCYRVLQIRVPHELCLAAVWRRLILAGSNMSSDCLGYVIPARSSWGNVMLHTLNGPNACERTLFIVKFGCMLVYAMHMSCIWTVWMCVLTTHQGTCINFVSRRQSVTFFESGAPEDLTNDAQTAAS